MKADHPDDAARRIAKLERINAAPMATGERNMGRQAGARWRSQTATIPEVRAPRAP